MNFYDFYGQAPVFMRFYPCGNFSDISLQHGLFMESFPTGHGDFPWLCKRLSEGINDNRPNMDELGMYPSLLGDLHIFDDKKGTHMDRL